MKLLFIGNSATYYHEIPKTLQKLSAQIGYAVETEQLTPGGYMLSQHADTETEHGKKVFAEIAKGYDIVFLQDNGNCIANEEKREACFNACRKLARAVKESGAKLYFYVRPPYKKLNSGYDSLQQCEKFDELFGEIAAELSAECIHVNRAFAYAIKNLDFNLWAEDNGHTSPHGAYLAVCTFFAKLFGKSATLLDPNGLPTDDARALQEAADKTVFDSSADIF